MMRQLPIVKTGLAVCLIGLFVLCTTRLAAHEPVFSPGPHTLYEGGVSTSIGSKVVAPDKGHSQLALELGTVYGINEDLNVAASLPIPVQRQTHEGKTTGIGSPALQLKWRPLKSTAPGRVDALSLIGAVRLPGGHHDLTRGNTGFVVGATAAREHQRYYLFGSTRYLMQTATPDGAKPGDVFMYDVATGIRPFILEYDQPDAVALVELNGRTQRPGQTPDATPTGGGRETSHHGLAPSGSSLQTRRQAHTGGTVGFESFEASGTELAVSPEVLLSWGPVMLKGGVQFPVYDTFSSPEATPDFRIKTTLLTQF